MEGKAFGAPVWVPPGQAQAVRQWDAGQLSYEATGQRCERFAIAGTLAPGSEFVAVRKNFEERGSLEEMKYGILEKKVYDHIIEKSTVVEVDSTEEKTE